MTQNSASNARVPVITDLTEGQFHEERIKITAEMVNAFIALTGDAAPVHVDAGHAAALGYSGPLVHGFLVASCYSPLLGMYLPGGNTVIQKIALDMLEPVYANDLLLCRVEVKRIITAVRGVVMRLSATDDSGRVVNRGEATCIFRA